MATRRRVGQGALRAAAAAHERMEDVAAAVGVTMARLSTLLVDRPKLRDAYERGRLLRDVGQLAGFGASYEEVAAALGKGAGELERLICDDPELSERWRSARVGTLRKMLAAQMVAAVGRPAKGTNKATAPNQAAIRAVLDRLTADTGRDGINLRALRTAETADVMGVSRQTLHTWATRGECPRNADGSYPLRELIEWRTRERIAQAGGVKKPDADRRYRDVKTEMAETELRRVRGELLDRQAVVAGLAARAHAAAKILDASAAIATAAECQGKPAARAVEIVAERFRLVRRELIDLDLAALRMPDDGAEDLRRLLGKLARGGIGG